MKALLEHVYKPRGACRELFKIKKDEVLISGPAGTGKSRACLEKLHAMALNNHGLRALIVRKTATSLTSTALVTWRTQVVEEFMLSGVVQYYGGSAQEPAQYRYTNGSKIVIGGMDRATRIMSSDYDIIYVQEAIELTENDWESLTTRLRNGKVSFQQLIADTNPDAEHHWLKVRCNRGQTVILESRHEDNPRLFNDDGTITEDGTGYIGKLDSLTGMRYQRLRRGLWVSAEGIIYEEYDPAIHLIDKFEIPEDWTRYWAIDFGYVNPFVCQWWAEDPDGRLYLYRELYRTKRTVDQHAKDMLSQVQDDDGKWIEKKPRVIVCDPADAEGRAQLEKYLGLGTTAAKKSVNDGIQAVQKRLREKRLFIMRDALTQYDPDLADAKKPVCTAEEIVGYIWADKKTKEEPVKENDHSMDSMRYMVADRDLVGSPRIRWL